MPFFRKSASTKAAIPFGYDGKDIKIDTKRETSPDKDEHKDDEDYEENSDAEFGLLRMYFN